MQRQIRRQHTERIKRKSVRKLIANRVLPEHRTPKLIGKYAAMHGTCDCWMCTLKDPPKYRQIKRDQAKLED